MLGQVLEKLDLNMYIIGEGNGNPLQYSCLENSMDGGAWWATVHRVTKSWTRLSDFMTSRKIIVQILCSIVLYFDLI